MPKATEPDPNKCSTDRNMVTVITTVQQIKTCLQLARNENGRFLQQYVGCVSTFNVKIWAFFSLRVTYFACYCLSDRFCPQAVGIEVGTTQLSLCTSQFCRESKQNSMPKQQKPTEGAGLNASISLILNSCRWRHIFFRNVRTHQ
jgi:hypothetical protein